MFLAAQKAKKKHLQSFGNGFQRTANLLLFAAGTLLLCITEGAPLANCVFEFASSLGTVGLSIGLTGPTTRAATLLVEIAGMLLGRLEIFLVFTGLGSAVFLMRQRRRR